MRFTHTARKWSGKAGIMARSKTDVCVLFATRILRMSGFGLLSVILALYLTELGFSEQTTGLLFTLALAGDILVSLVIATSADRVGRRPMLILGAFLIMLAGGILTFSQNAFLIGMAIVVGVVSPSGNEIGPFLSIEQAALTQITGDRNRTHTFAWYNLAGLIAASLGALGGGALVAVLQRAGQSELGAYQAVFFVYLLLGVCLAILFVFLSPGIEARPAESHHADKRFGLHRSKGIVYRLSCLFALDAFAGGFVIQSLMAYWFHQRFGAGPIELGGIFFIANVLAAISGLVAARLALRIGLVKTMVFTHIPSNILLMLVPFMPDLYSATAVLFLRFSISQMDVPTRQSYTMAVVSPDERSAASGVTATARSVGALISPALSGQLLAVPMLMGVPFILAGGLKIIYDVLLYRSFQSVKPPEEQAAEQSR
jgi:MFS family permease